MATKLIRFSGVSEHFNPAEVDYRKHNQLSEEEFDEIAKWQRRVDDGRRRYVNIIEQECVVPFKGRILDLAAGSGWLSSEISKKPEVTEVYTLDASEEILEQVTPHIFEYLKADQDKITRVVGDFHKLEFEDNFFDIVLIDAGLHHAVDLRALLREIQRVLKPGGVHVAIRELITPPVRFKKISKERKRLIAQGVTENMYPMSEWRQAFEDCGLNFRAVKVNLKSGLKRALERVVNGIFHCRFVLVGEKR